jgi:hypothetical protein
MTSKLLGTATLLCASLTLSQAQDPSGIDSTTTTVTAPNGIAAARNPTITYHGGPVLGTVAGQAVHLYFIFYGAWATSDAGGPDIMHDFASQLGGSGYWNILTSYVEPSGAFIHNALTLAGKVDDTGSEGNSLTDATLQKVVQKWIGNGTFPSDTNAIYEVLSSAEVDETSGFCSSYCGFHNHMNFQGKDIKYAFIGNPVHCKAQGGVGNCVGLKSNVSKSPNDDPGVDAMVSIIAHESDEATSDPDLNGWYFNGGGEDGDQCAYKYGKTFAVSNGSQANIKLGRHDYLIQEDWIAKPGQKRCAMSY